MIYVVVYNRETGEGDEVEIFKTEAELTTWVKENVVDSKDVRLRHIIKGKSMAVHTSVKIKEAKKEEV
jgi:hypothetical protein